MKKLFLSGIFAASIFSTAQASVVINLSDDGTDLFAEAYGSLDLSGYSISGLNGGSGGVLGDDYLAIGNNLDDNSQFRNVYLNAIVSGPSSWGSGPTRLSYGGISSGGLVIGISAGTDLNVDQLYTFGTEFYSFNLFEDSTVDMTNLTQGRHEFVVSNGEIITLNIGNDFVQPASAQVPLPATLPLLVGSLVGGFAVVRRKKHTPL